MNFTHLSLPWRRWSIAGLACAGAMLMLPAWAANNPAPRGSDVVLDAREALKRGDRARLATLRAAAVNTQNPLAMWVDYWELSQRLLSASPNEVSEFYARWPDTYVEDRLRNDWLLELGRRRDWGHFSTEFARFRMNDDREVNCYALLLRHQSGEDVTALARNRWLARRDTDDGCTLLATTLYQERRFTEADAWMKVRLAGELNRSRVAKQAAALLGDPTATVVGEIFDNPGRYLARESARRNGPLSRKDTELLALALTRLADSDASAAAAQLEERWTASLPPATLVWVWAAVAKQAAMDLLPQAHEWYRRSASVRGAGTVQLSDDMLGWKARAALRAEGVAGRWEQLLDAIEAMSPAEQRDSAWVYWKARALKLTAAPSPDAGGDVQRAQAMALLEGLAGQMNFYGKLAAEELGRTQLLPPKPTPLTTDERGRARTHAGLTRALALIAIGLRDEGVREWNFSLRGMDDRELRAAAQRACDAEIWDRCINTSERTSTEIDIDQRFPTPFRRDIESAAREVGMDAAYVYGVIRQESRFVVNVRSAVGASGLMQLMPGTARWTARKIGVSYRPDLINDPGTNLKLGTNYLKLVLDNFGGSQALAAAAYNAGPNRPRRWRDGPTLEVAAWAENIPFGETRDYVKKVLSNATYYGAILRGEMLSLKTRLAVPIGPPMADAPPENEELP